MHYGGEQAAPAALEKTTFRVGNEVDGKVGSRLRA